MDRDDRVGERGEDDDLASVPVRDAACVDATSLLRDLGELRDDLVNLRLRPAHGIVGEIAQMT